MALTADALGTRRVTASAKIVRKKDDGFAGHRI
jgi:hypothetical protein